MTYAQTIRRPATDEAGDTDSRKYQDGDRVKYQPTDSADAFNNAQLIGATGTVEGAEKIVTREFSMFLGWEYRVRMDGGALWIVHDYNLAPAT
jgi:hypothetical protein